MATETFKIPSPVLIGVVPKPGEQDTRTPYSFAEMVRHFQRKAREYNASMDGARQGQRTLAAVENPDATGVVTLQRADCRVLKQLVEKPSCGWIDARKKQPVIVPARKPGADPQLHEVWRRIDVPAVTFMTFADAVPGVAADD